MPDASPLKSLKPHYPVLIIGAGTNACGLFRDLCLQGVDCRRTAIAMEGLLSFKAVDDVAEVAAAALGWDDRRSAFKIDQARAEMKRRAVPDVTAARAAA